MLAFIDNDSISCILHVRMELPHRLCLPSLPTSRLFGNDAMGTDEGPSSTNTWRRQIGDSLQTWAAAVKADLEPLFGPGIFGFTRQKMDWKKLSSGLTQESYVESATLSVLRLSSLWRNMDNTVCPKL